MYYRLGTARYQPITTDHGIVLRKAGAAGPRVGDTRIEGGKSQRFNENHRWENVKEAPGQMDLFGGLATVQDAPGRGYYSANDKTYVDLDELVSDTDAFVAALNAVSSGKATALTDRNRHVLNPEFVPDQDQDFPGQTRTQAIALMNLNDFIENVEAMVDELSADELNDAFAEIVDNLGYQPGTIAYLDEDGQQEKEQDFMQQWPSLLEQAGTSDSYEVQDLGDRSPELDALMAKLKADLDAGTLDYDNDKWDDYPFELFERAAMELGIA